MTGSQLMQQGLAIIIRDQPGTALLTYHRKEVKDSDGEALSQWRPMRDSRRNIEHRNIRTSNIE
jgi:hypothetical protein